MVMSMGGGRGTFLARDYDSSPRVFHQVSRNDPNGMRIISEIFQRVLNPLYGPQDKAIRQIEESRDRKCFLLCEERMPVGVLVFKTVLSNEYADYGITDSIEIKSLFVDRPSENSGKGLGSALVNKLRKEIGNLKLRHRGIHVTVSEKKQESLIFFQKKGFKIAHSWKGRYQDNTTEYLLSCPARIQQIRESGITELEKGFKQLSLQKVDQLSSRYATQLIKVIYNAHLDDIHALKKLSDDTFVSGSKDNCLYKWNQKGECVRIIDEVEPTQQDERNWITAVEILNDDYWLSGDRSGKVSLWNTKGEYLRNIQLMLPKFGRHFSHEYNKQRVLCLAKGLNPYKPSFFVGFPTMFDEFNFIEGRTVSSVPVHKNDWVYSLHPLNEKEMLTVTGCTVDLWNKGVEDRWDVKDTLVQEGDRYWDQRGGKWRRPFISSLVPLCREDNHFGLSLFDGSVKVIDIINKAVVVEWKEHVGRAWQIEAINRQLFASSGEDRSIKFWDSRVPEKSVHTISDHVGQVTSLLSFDERMLIAGTCPEHAYKTNSGAEIRFYDVRR